jgi:hypothetical protein
MKPIRLFVAALLVVFWISFLRKHHRWWEWLAMIVFSALAFLEHEPFGNVHRRKKAKK